MVDSTAAELKTLSLCLHKFGIASKWMLQRNIYLQVTEPTTQALHISICEISRTCVDKLLLSKAVLDSRQKTAGAKCKLVIQFVEKNDGFHFCPTKLIIQRHEMAIRGKVM